MKKDRFWWLILVIFQVLCGYLGYTGNGFIFKAAVAGTGILIILMLYNWRIRQMSDVWFIIAAFAFSIAGDWYLSHRHGISMRFIYGILFFFLAHVGYFSYSLLKGSVNWFYTSVLLAGYMLFFWKCLYPSITDPVLLTAVLVYMIISCLSLGTALGLRIQPTAKWVFVSGIFLILFSDTIIGFREFTSFKNLSFLILPTYYMAQISITAAIIINRNSKDVCI